MPFGIHKHSNRSSKALNVQAQGTSPSESSASFASTVGTEEAKTTQPQAYQQPSQQRLPQQQQQYPAAQAPGISAGADFDRGPQQQPGNSPVPSRSQSTRQGSSYPQLQNLPQAGASVDNLVLDTRRLQKQRQAQPESPVQSPVVEQKKSKSIFDRMRSRNNAPEQKAASSSQNAYNNTAGLARRVSKRSEGPPVIRTSQQRSSIDQQQRGDWQQSQDPRTHLPSPQEGVEDDSGLDPYLITETEQEEEPRSAAHEQTIRLARSDSDPPAYPPIDDTRQQYQAHLQRQSLGYPQVQQQFDPPPHNHYQQPPTQNQQLNTQQDSLGITHDYYRQPNPETVSQLSYESPVDPAPVAEQRPVSVQSNENSPIGGQNTGRQQYPNRTTSIQGSVQPTRPLSQYGQMAPPPTGASQPNQNRRPGDSKQTMQGNQGPPDSRDGPPNPAYRQFPPGGTTPTTGPSQSPIPPVVGNQGPNYRGGPPQREQYGPSGGGEQGRSTPPPAPGERDVNDAYKELLQKYKKVKGLYFDKTAQVEQLQNTLANQRLSQSRTSLDDSEYMTRFQRLDGATTNLAFNIRKDWRTIPHWLAPYVNQDALKVGKQEMTAVGRACISRFLMDEIFNRTFHPSLEGELSTNLKNIETNIRRFSPLLNNQEESDALTAKVVQWRLATLDGLRDVLNAPESEDYRRQFSQLATTRLTANLITYLGEPVPAGIEDSAHMIVELAVSIAANLPLESRDISIIYPMPGDLVQPFIMKVESGSGMPLLDNPGMDTSSEVDASSTASGDKDEVMKDSEKDGKNSRKEKTKSTGMLQAMMGGNSSGAGPAKLSKVNANSQVPPEGSEAKGKVSSEEGPQKVRFSGFVGVEVRGRQMLMKAPVWTIG